MAGVSRTGHWAAPGRSHWTETGTGSGTGAGEEEGEGSVGRAGSVQHLAGSCVAAVAAS